MQPKSWIAVALLSLSAAACGGGSESSDTSDDALAQGTASTSEYLYVAPELKAGAHAWQTIVVQTKDFDGTLAFRSSAGGEPDQLIVIDKRSGAVSFVSGEALAPTDDWEASRKELSEASDQLTLLAGDFDTGDTRFAALVNDHNKCFIKEAAIGLALVGAVVAAPIVIEAAPGLAAGALASAQEAGAAVAANGLRAFVVQAGKTALTNPTMQKYLAYHVAKTAVKGWLLFSDKGRELTRSVIDQAKEVMHADCHLASPDAYDGTLVQIMSTPR